MGWIVEVVGLDYQNHWGDSSLSIHHRRYILSSERGAVRIVHMIFLSFDGFPMKAPIPITLVGDIIRSLQAMHELGVLQKDPRAPNILVYPERPGITWIDFERVELFSPRVALGELLANRKRKPDFHEGVKFPNRSDQEWAKGCAKEVVEAATELNRIVLR